MDDNQKYTMGISLNVLNHLGINLYSNIAAVISEVVANAWDADATRVDITFEPYKGVVEVIDNGIGMTLADVNERFLNVGYQRREAVPGRTALGRDPMGRKGIGKLSLFSIAQTIDVHTVKSDETNAFRLDLNEIKDQIKAAAGNYSPKAITFIPPGGETGTRIVLSNFRRDLSKTEISLRRRLARRFSVIGLSHNFRVYVNGDELTPSDRQYESKAQYVWVFGSRAGEFAAQFAGKAKVNKFESAELFPPEWLTGWIATATESTQLRDGEQSLNSIVLMMRGRLAQEDILDSLGFSGVFSKYIFGEVHADFLDVDDKDDIATSSRQALIEDDQRYLELKEFLRGVVAGVRKNWNDWRGEQGVSYATSIPQIQAWYATLPGDHRETAKRLFSRINRLPIDNMEERRRLIKHSVLAIESFRYSNTLDRLDALGDNNIDALIVLFKEFDDIEASLYYQITKERIAIIKALLEKVDKNDREKAIQDHLFKHLWLLDPAWERAADPEALMEHRFVTHFMPEANKGLSQKEKNSRYDIKYKMAYGKHVIVELKRSGRSITFHELSKQTSKYYWTMGKLLEKADRPSEPVEVVCVLGDWPVEWSDAKVRSAQERQLAEEKTRVTTYDALLDRAHRQYEAYIEDAKQAGKVFDLIRTIDEAIEAGVEEAAE